jgi:hypothetical protein
MGRYSLMIWFCTALCYNADASSPEQLSHLLPSGPFTLLCVDQCTLSPSKLEDMVGSHWKWQQSCYCPSSHAAFCMFPGERCIACYDAYCIPHTHFLTFGKMFDLASILKYGLWLAVLGMDMHTCARTHTRTWMLPLWRYGAVYTIHELMFWRNVSPPCSRLKINWAGRQCTEGG